MAGRRFAAILACHTCQEQYGTCTKHPYSLSDCAWTALDAAAPLLGGALVAHMRQTHRRAQALAVQADVSGRERDLWAAAALVHDVGYAHPVTGHHWIDGARWLARRGFPAELTGLVAWHSTSIYELVERGENPIALMTEFPVPDPEGLSVLWVADFTTSHYGEPVTSRERIEAIRSGNGPDSPVVRALDASLEDYRRAEERLGVR